MSRAVKEWIGKTPDTAVPSRVKIRVFEKFHHRCPGCTREIITGMWWECDHVIALINGGENRETNLQPLCEQCHPEKTKADVAEKSKTYKTKRSHYGKKNRSGRPMLGSKDSDWKKTFGHGWVRR